MIYTYGYISKAHYNPSITIAFMIRNIPQWPRDDYIQCFMYFIMEYTGAIVGGLLSWLFGGNESALVYPSTILNTNNGILTPFIIFRSFMAELIFTFILASVILSVATDKRQSGNQFYGISIGLTVTVSIICIGNISGCCLNSAVWLGCIIPALIVDKKINLNDAWIYWIAPFIGGIIAAIVFNLLYGKYKVKNEDKYNNTKCISLASFSELKDMTVCETDGACESKNLIP